MWRRGFTLYCFSRSSIFWKLWVRGRGLCPSRCVAAMVADECGGEITLLLCVVSDPHVVGQNGTDRNDE